jgi:hypothetical protein
VRQPAGPAAKVETADRAAFGQSLGLCQRELPIDIEQRFPREEPAVIGGDLVVVDILPDRAGDARGKLPVGALEGVGDGASLRRRDRRICRFGEDLWIA